MADKQSPNLTFVCKTSVLNIEQLYEVFLQNSSVQTDTRKLKAGDLFFALSGPNFNGNQFARAALDAGASYAVVDEWQGVADARIIQVPDVLLTLQQLATHHRRQFNIPFIAITGSNGKTTTKELVSAVLSTTFTTYTTRGNLNNHIGVPLTLLGIRSDAQMAVIEMGANHLHEIESYCKWALPTHGIITNCGKAHLEGFGSVEGVRRGKGELFDYLRENGGTAFIYNDYDYLQQMSTGIAHVVRYGTKNGFVTGDVLPSETFLSVEIRNPAFDVHTRLVGDYNLPNVLCAVAVGEHFKVPQAKIKEALQNYTPTNSRSQLIDKGTNKFILDAYNANPTSIKAALENFARIPASNKVVMLGAMMELGEDSIDEHRQVISLLEAIDPGQVVLVGGDFAKVPHPFTWFESAAVAQNWFRQQQFENTYFLIKGSRSMQMEKILE